MKRIVGLILLCLLMLACVHEDPTASSRNYAYNCIFVNMGNYAESNGSIALYNSATGELNQEVYAKANNRALAAIIESVVYHEDFLLLLCNNADKLVFLNPQTMQELREPITEIGIPRYGVIQQNVAYVSCWDKVNKQSGQVQIPQHISKIDIISKTVIGSIPTSGKPEGLLLYGDTLFVASGYGLEVFDLSADTLLKKIDSQFSQAEAQQLLMDKNKQLWLSLGSYGDSGGFMVVDIASLTVTAQIAEPKLFYEGEIALNPTKDRLYFLSADGIVGGQSAEVSTSIYAIAVDAYQVSSTPVVSGVGFYGIAVDPVYGTIYTANVNGFITNSMSYVFSPSGVKINEFLTGVGTSRFVFK